MTHNERVLRLLKDGEPHTHHELYALHVIGHSRVSDLRAHGYLIEQWREGDDYLYRLVGFSGAVDVAAARPGPVEKRRERFPLPAPGAQLSLTQPGAYDEAAT